MKEVPSHVKAPQLMIHYLQDKSTTDDNKKDE